MLLFYGQSPGLIIKKDRRNDFTNNRCNFPICEGGVSSAELSFPRRLRVPGSESGRRLTRTSSELVVGSQLP